MFFPLVAVITHSSSFQRHKFISRLLVVILNSNAVASLSSHLQPYGRYGLSLSITLKLILYNRYIVAIFQF